LFAPGATVLAQPTFSSDSEFETFRLIVNRNIFDPNRRPDEPIRDQEPSFTPEVPEPPPTERLVLLGVLINGSEVIAFFDGSESGYKTAVDLGGAIAGQRVAEIRTDFVKLENKGRTIDLPVGLSIRREDPGEWEIDSEYRSSSRLGSTLEKGRESGAGDSSEGGKAEDTSADDVLKRMIERRKKEVAE
jgi:hypothetical protein